MHVMELMYRDHLYIHVLGKTAAVKITEYFTKRESVWITMVLWYYEYEKKITQIKLWSKTGKSKQYTKSVIYIYLISKERLKLSNTRIIYISVMLHNSETYAINAFWHFAFLYIYKPRQTKTNNYLPGFGMEIQFKYFAAISVFTCSARSFPLQNSIPSRIQQ